MGLQEDKYARHTAGKQGDAPLGHSLNLKQYLKFTEKRSKSEAGMLALAKRAETKLKMTFSALSSFQKNHLNYHAKIKSPAKNFKKVSFF